MWCLTFVQWSWWHQLFPWCDAAQSRLQLSCLFHRSRCRWSRPGPRCSGVCAVWPARPLSYLQWCVKVTEHLLTAHGTMPQLPHHISDAFKDFVSKGWNVFHFTVSCKGKNKKSCTGCRALSRSLYLFFTAFFFFLEIILIFTLVSINYTLILADIGRNEN